MSDLMLTVLFNGGLIVLLIVTIGYCSRLSGRIRQLQDGRSELATMIAKFDNATGRAMNSMAELQTVSKKITEALQLKIDKANFLADDLAFLIEKSTKLAAQLEQNKAVRPPATAITMPAKPKPAFEAKALFDGGPQLVKPAHMAGPTDAASTARATASLEAILQRLAPSIAAAPKPAQNPPSARTEAERELLEALKGR